MTLTPEERAQLIIKGKLSQDAWYSASLLAELIAVIEQQRVTIQKLRKAGTK